MADRLPAVLVGSQSAASAARWDLPFDYAVEHGFAAFEWFPDKKPWGGWASGDLSRAARRRIRRIARAHQIRLSVHASLPAVDPRDDDPARLAADLELARDIGATLLNVHLELGEGLDAFVAAIEPLIDELARSGIALAIENTPSTGPADFNALFGQLARPEPTARAQVGMCLDIGHANLFSATHNDYLRFVDLLGPEVPLIHLHLHENHGEADTHLPLFTGPAAADPAGVAGLLERLGRRGFAGAAILEQWPSPPELLLAARDRLNLLLGQLR